MGEHIKTYRGKFTGTQILCEDGEVVEARPYGSQYQSLLNKQGFFNVKFLDDWTFGIIIEAVPENGDDESTHHGF